ncbi:hypothetical protein HBI18_181880 [Parastagonospora nodorum]|nr:hypothetical protein HBI79_184770 [Parastagonospora nodorum]KAH4957393.1 hypothetical protein HBI78_190290 [Parastagonospora nodorum]KAH5238546.1 hypothetical protein HBI71_231190 [Parastagonospora nodorum]KAH5411718.1 hypothetical protein HBI46_160840 [Parastagonospora nodorum]KAH5490527.1 hypothetical protein HBI29_203120 [Parastagonospora nodorum]
MSTYYLFKLTPTLSSPSQIRALSDLTNDPEIMTDDDNPNIRFVIINTQTRTDSVTHLSSGKGLFIPLPTPAAKELSDDKVLGNREMTAPGQNEYPVTYFFYGTLGEPEKLGGVIGLGEVPVLARASVKGGKIKTWGGKYRALVDGSEEDVVEGAMYIVTDKAEEDALRHYEGASYEVVRCEIHTESGEKKQGLTFRWCGQEDLGDVV